MSVKLGAADAVAFGCALLPGCASLCQMAIQVPGSLEDGNYPLKVSVGGGSSPDAVGQGFFSGHGGTGFVCPGHRPPRCLRISW